MRTKIPDDLQAYINSLPYCKDKNGQLFTDHTTGKQFKDQLDCLYCNSEGKCVYDKPCRFISDDNDPFKQIDINKEMNGGF
jgi:hypothetical protein